MSESKIKQDKQINANLVTPINEWLEPYSEGVLIELRSMRKIKMRPVAMDELLRLGKIPDMLSSLAARSLWDTVPIDQAMEDNFKTANDLVELMSIILPSCIVYPPIYTGDAELPEGMIKLEHLSLLDKLDIFQLALQPVDVLVRFRNKQIGDVASIQSE